METVQIFGTEIGMQVGLKTCGVLAIKRGKMVRCDGIVLPNGDVMKEVDKEGHYYLGIVELDKIKKNERKNYKGIPATTPIGAKTKAEW